jgi:hypothetical protein
VDEGLCYFEPMGSVYGLPATVEYNACMVGLLGCAGNLHEAEDIIKGMSCQPNETVWTALLSVCRIHGDLELGEHLVKQLLEPGNAGGYVLLSNVYAAAGKWGSQ